MPATKWTGIPPCPRSGSQWRWYGRIADRDGTAIEPPPGECADCWEWRRYRLPRSTSAGHGGVSVHTEPWTASTVTTTTAARCGWPEPNWPLHDRARQLMPPDPLAAPPDQHFEQ
ncbi:hypothetical protein Amac_021890 [Acrocarpospora macrocephala]|uniref:Uncharacterized protein n=1 Tax=Acrocarpospora macrocephala TaxID=150177 RepID=A0A5M3WPB7_9ACTN|nr:hypothetical protein Amac_021890 [Acrocarpospora macrocephala]